MISRPCSKSARGYVIMSGPSWQRISGPGSKATMSPNSEPLFDLLSYARRGPGRRDRVSSADLAHIGRTAGRTPEVMVKVLSRGANDLAAVRKHLEYIGRKGKVDLETDGAD